jgi:hypothetical protein
MPVRLGDAVPDFFQVSTESPIQFHQWIGAGSRSEKAGALPGQGGPGRRRHAAATAYRRTCSGGCLQAIGSNYRSI